MLALRCKGPHARNGECSPKKLGHKGGLELTANNGMGAQSFSFKEPDSTNNQDAVGRRFFPELLNETPALILAL